MKQLYTFHRGLNSHEEHIVEADDEGAALIAAYDQIEHLTGVTITPIKWETIAEPLRAILQAAAVDFGRIASHESDVYIMCATRHEAEAIKAAADSAGLCPTIDPTNPEHPDAQKWPLLVDVPFQFLPHWERRQG